MGDSRHSERFIFIGGVPRSGTTLIQNIMDSHPDVFGGPEFDQLPNIIDLRRQMLGSIQSGRINMYCHKKDVDNAIGGMIEQLLLPAADRAGCKYLCDKHPDTATMMTELLQVLKSARMILIVRDPRSVISSLLQVGAKARQMGGELDGWYADVDAAINSVKIYADAAVKSLKLDSSRIYPIRYEDIVTDLEPHTRALCDFLGIPWHENMIHPGEHKHAIEKVMFSDPRNEAWYDKKSYYRDPEPVEIEKWRNNLSDTDATKIANAFRSHLLYVNLGYDLSS